MDSALKIKSGTVYAVLLLGVSMTIGVLSSTKASVLFFVLLFSIFIFASLIYPRETLLVILFARTLMDNYADRTINIGGIINLNVQSIFGFLIIILLFIFYISGKLVRDIKLTVSIMTFILVSALSIFISIYRFESMFNLLRILSLFSVYFIIYSIVSLDKEFKNKIFNCILFSSLIPLGIGLYQIIFNNSSYHLSGIQLHRINSTFYHPTQFALFLLIVSAICYCKLLDNTGRRFLYLGLMVLCAVEILFTFTRAAMIGYVLFWTVIWFYRKNKIKNLILALVIVAVFGFFFSDIVAQRFEELLPGNSLEQTSEGTRYSLWVTMLPIAFESPIYGYGSGTFLPFSAIIRGNGLNAHNDYLRVFFENGLLGLASFFFIIIQLYSSIFSLIKRRFRGYIVVFLALLSIFLIIALNDNVFFNISTMWYFWAFAASTLAYYEHLNKDGLYEERTELLWY